MPLASMMIFLSFSGNGNVNKLNGPVKSSLIPLEAVRLCLWVIPMKKHQAFQIGVSMKPPASSKYFCTYDRLPAIWQAIARSLGNNPSGQLDERDLRQYAYPARITDKAETPVHIKLLATLLVKSGPLPVNILHRAPFEPG